jgi:DNA-binding SARP family transcriptional activator
MNSRPQSRLLPAGHVRRRPAARGLNLAFFTSDQRTTYGDLVRAIARSNTACRLLLVSDGLSGAPEMDKNLAVSPPDVSGLPFCEAGFLQDPVSFRAVMRRLCEHFDAFVAQSGKAGAGLVVDMSWALASHTAAANFQDWMAVAEALVERLAVPVVSVYNRKLLIDEQLLSALHGHPKILSATGVKNNPFWLPSETLSRGTRRQQIDHWLLAISPDLAVPQSQPPCHAAEGANPMWLLRRGVEDAGCRDGDIHGPWRIRCFGRLRVSRNNGAEIVWDAPGGATRKTKTLFAYLLHKGGDGADAEDLADLLWPEAASQDAARNRLHHTVRYLRCALAPEADADDAGHLLREGSRYILAPPERSSLDISSFEQLCRQSIAHIQAAAMDEALLCVLAAERLYTGDLFADIPVAYVDDSSRDWCWSRRIWLREMFLKVQRDAAMIYRRRQDYSSALAHCQKALAIDPLCEIAHEEAMLIFDAQSRHDAVDRQFKLYMRALGHFDDRPLSKTLQATYDKIKSKGKSTA